MEEKVKGMANQAIVIWPFSGLDSQGELKANAFSGMKLSSGSLTSNYTVMYCMMIAIYLRLQEIERR